MVALSKKKTYNQRMPIYPSEFCEYYFDLNGKALSLKEYEYLRLPYDDNARKQILVFGRQAGKSTLLAAKMLAIMSMKPLTSALHVSPALQNLTQFNADRLTPFIESPRWRSKYYASFADNNMSRKTLKNGSSINLRAVFTGADRIRGLTAGYVQIDELQDVETDAIEVIESVQVRPEFKMTVMAGTQSHMESSVNHYWELSDQKEFMIVCGGCGRFNELDEDNIGKKGLICRKCKGDMDPRKDHWEWVITAEEADYSGYRFPQIAIPGIDWREILDKYERFSQKNFYNDILALPHDLSGKPITRAQLRAACIGPNKFLAPGENGGSRTYAGIDWGAGLGSATVLCVMRERSAGKSEVIYAKRYTGYESDPIVQRQLIETAIQQYSCQFICADWGGQYEQNKQLAAVVGPHRFQSVMLTSDQKEIMAYNPKKGFWTASKEQSLSDTFMAIKKLDITFPAWETIRPFAEEILHEFQEYSETSRRTVYDHPPEKPDDFLHALNFAFLARGLSLGKYRPGTYTGYDI